MIRNFILKLLLRYADLGGNPLDISNDAVKNWLERQGDSQGFMEYLRQRKISLRRKAATKTLDEDQRQQIVGQIIELETLQHYVQKSSQES